jgi:amino acid adenylation domain-containing protein
MIDLEKRLAGLSPDKLELLRARLQGEAKVEARPPEEPPAIAPRPDERYQPFPLTEVQEAYWIGRSGLYDLGTGGANSYMEYEFSGAGEAFVDRLEGAFQEFVERHDMMRAVVLPDGRQQVLAEVPPFQIARVDLRGRDPGEAATELQRVRDRMCEENGRLERWPLFEVRAHFLDGERLRLHLRFDALLKDGRARAILFEELPRLFFDLQSALPALEITYRDYAVTRADFQQTALYRRSRDYWRERLPDLPPPPALPLAVDLGPRTSSHFRLRSVDLLAAEPWRQLKERAARQGLTPSTAVLAAYVEAIAAWSEVPRFTLALIGSDRPPVHPQIEAIFGNFNTTYLHAVERRSGPFAARAKRLQEQVNADLEHRYFSGLQVLRELNRLAGGPSRAAAPICFNSVVRNSRAEPEPTDAWTAQETAAPAPQPGAAEPDPEAAEPATPTRAVTAILAQGMDEIEGSVNIPQVLLLPTLLEDDGGALVCKWQAVEDAFPAGLLDDLLAGYTRLLERLAGEDAAWQESAFELLSAAQLVERAAAEAEVAPPPRLDEQVAARARERQADPAVLAGERTLTYEELWRQAERLAGRLRALGARPDAPVAVVLDAGWEQAVGALAVLRSGAALLPLDPGLPADRLRRLLAHGEVKLALTRSALDARLAWPAGIRRLAVDVVPPAADGVRVEEPSVAEPAHDPADGDLACILYAADAGSDSPPRGVMVEHRALASALVAAARELHLGPGDRVLSLFANGSARALFDLLAPLVAGAAVVCPEPAQERLPSRWAERIAGREVTVCSSPPALLDRLAAHLEAGGAGPAPRSLRLALLGGDPVPLGLPGRLAALFPGVEVANSGGFPEASVVSALGAVTPLADFRARFPWGRPLAGQRLHVLDDELRPRPTWVAGDLYLGGAGLARGYWRDEAATGAAFLVHPRTGERLFRTGVLARFLAGGEVELLGPAAEFRVEAAGRLVEPRRVEAALERHPAVRVAVVLPRRDGDGRTRLAGFAAAAGDRAGELAGFLAERLPAHLVPAAITAVDELPLTAAGAVERAALAATLAPAPAPAAVAPRDPLERELAAIWQDLLGVAPASVTDDFFALGGNSLLATRLLVRLRERFGLAEALPGFLERPTLEQLAATVRRARAARAAERPSGLGRLLPWLDGRRRRRRSAAAAAAIPSHSYGMRTFLVLWIGRFISGMGTGLGSFSLGVWTFKQHASTTQFAMVGLAAMLTGMIVMPIAGSAADRFDRRKVIILSDICSSLVAFSMAFGLYTHHLQVWHVYPIAVLMTIFGTFQGPALMASISQLVPRRQLVRANSMSTMVGTVAGMVTPILAGVLVGWIGYHGVILIDFLTFLFGAATILWIRLPRPLASGAAQEGGRRSVLGDLRFGWDYLKTRSGLLALTLLFALTGFSAGIVQVLLYPLILGLGTPAALGTVTSAEGVGILAGSLLLTTWGGPQPNRRVWAIFWCMVLQGCLLFLGGAQPSIPLVAFALCLASFTAPIIGASNQTIWQSKIPLDVQGRLFGFRGLVGTAVAPVAYLLAGPLADRVFKPLLVPGGPLAGSVGRVIGVGPGRGVGLLFIVLGVFMNLTVVVSYLNPRLRHVESELPDVPQSMPGAPPPRDERVRAAAG